MHEKNERTNRLRYHSAAGARPMSAGRVMQVGIIAFLVAGLLNADSLHDQAIRQPFGWKRTVAEAAVWPFRTVSHATGLSKPREVIQTSIGRDPKKAAEAKKQAKKSGISRKPTVDLSEDAPPPAFVLREPTAEAPLRVWVGGDSMTQVFGQSLVDRCGERGTLECTLDYRISTGLTRPDYFDWPAHLADEVLPAEPEVIVIMFGANDAQSMELESGVFAVRDQPWKDEYRKRVAATMDLLAGNGRLVIWVGQPTMRKAEFSERMDIVDQIYAEEALKRPWVRFLDSRKVLSVDGGTSYQATLPDDSGTHQPARQSDGIHLSRFGGDVLADAALALLDEQIVMSLAHQEGNPPATDEGSASPTPGG